MTAIALGLTWAVVVAVALGVGGVPARLPHPGGPTLTTPRPVAFLSGRAVAGVDLPAPATAIGAWLRRTGRRPPDRDADRRVGRAALAAAVLAPWAPLLAIVPVAWSLLAPALASRLSTRAHEAAITDQLPDVVDLLVLTTAAGLPIAAALCAIGRRPGGPHHTPVGRGLVATTVETVRFSRPETVDFRLVRGPVPHVVERFTLLTEGGDTRLEYTGELGADFWAAGRWWGGKVASVWEAAVRSSLERLRGEAERRAAKTR
jgi:hypothetical protein